MLKSNNKTRPYIILTLSFLTISMIVIFFSHIFKIDNNSKQPLLFNISLIISFIWIYSLSMIQVYFYKKKGFIEFSKIHITAIAIRALIIFIIPTFLYLFSNIILLYWLVGFTIYYIFFTTTELIVLIRMKEPNQ